MALLSTVYTNARNYINGADSTNAPDSKLLAPANSLHRFLALLETPRPTLYAGGTFGANSLSVAGVRRLSTVGTNFARVLGVRYTTDPTATDGVLLERFASKGEYELEASTFPGTNGVPRGYFPERQPSGIWVLNVHPATSAVDIYLPVEVEVEPQDLTSGASTLVLTPGNVSRMEKMLAGFIGMILEQDEAYMTRLFADMGERKIMADWLKSEESKGMLVKRAA